MYITNTSKFVINRLLIWTNYKYCLPTTEAQVTNSSIKIFGTVTKISQFIINIARGIRKCGWSPKAFSDTLRTQSTKPFSVKSI